MNPTIGDVYYKGDNAWSETYADRKIYSAKSVQMLSKQLQLLLMV